jgi:ABC-type bacteriocin/lantibiotic exporter with double-glycine peptidase domain
VGCLSCLWHERIWFLWFPNEIRWLAKQIRPLVHWHIGSFLCITAGSLFALLTPLILKWLIDAIIPQRRIGLLLFAVVLILLAHQGRTALNSFGSFLMLTAAQKMGLALRMSLLRHLDTLSAEYYEDTPVGAVMYPLKEPIDEISYFGSDLVPAILRMLLTTGFTLATMFVLSPMLTLTVVPLLPIFLITRHYYRKRLGNDADATQRDRLAWTNFLQEHLSAAIPIQLVGQERRQERRAFQLLAHAVRSQQQLYRTATWFTVCSSLAVVLAMCAVIGYGGVSVLAGTLSLGSLVAFYGFVSQLFDPLSGAAELYARAQKTFASVRQVQSALALAPKVASAPASVSIPKDHPARIEFSHVEFGYAGRKDLLHIPSLRILAGEHVAIAGVNGAGKSTFVKLVARLYDPVSGSIHVSGLDVRSVDLKSLRDFVCYLPRDPILFDGTILSNLRFVCPGVAEHELNEVIQCSGLSGLITSLCHGVHQRIGPGGCQLSGGERQRLAIARAILQRPRVLILDEATSCLDPAAEAAIIRNLQLRLATTTLIVISHRPATFSRFRRILVLSQGRIIQDGSRSCYALAAGDACELDVQG